MKFTRRNRAAAFTLVEMLAVIVIIMILSAVVLAGLKYATDKQNNEKTRVQLARISNALEDYKVDKGLYPPTEDTETGTGNSPTLFSALYWDSDEDGQAAEDDSDQKIYLPELDPGNRKLGWLDGNSIETFRIVDSWGNEIRYRSAVNAAGQPNPNTERPDFDLWSSGKDGNSGDAKSGLSQDDLKAP
ncbi:MAG: type II secretion system protein [Luteolibacter sp.]